MPNLNTTEYLNKMCHKIFKQLDEIEPVPGVQLKTGQGGNAPANPLPVIKRLKNTDDNDRVHKSNF